MRRLLRIFYRGCIVIDYARKSIENLPLELVECSHIGGFLLKHNNSDINFEMINNSINSLTDNFVDYCELLCDRYRPNGRYLACLLVPQHPTNVVYDRVVLARDYGAILSGTSYWADVPSNCMSEEEAVATSKVVFTHHDTDLTLAAMAMRKSVRLVSFTGHFYEAITSVMEHQIYMPRIAVSRMLSNPMSGFMINCTRDDIDNYIDKVMHVNI